MSSTIRQIYSDESGFPKSEIQTLAALIGEGGDLHLLSTELASIATTYDIGELKRTRMRSNHAQFSCAMEMLPIFFAHLEAQQLSLALLSGVYQQTSPLPTLYHLLADSWHHRHPRIIFQLFPDANNAFGWHRSDHLLAGYEYIASVHPIRSEHSILTQLCDLFAGMTSDLIKHPSHMRYPTNLTTFTYKQRLRESFFELARTYGLRCTKTGILKAGHKKILATSLID